MHFDIMLALTSCISDIFDQADLMSYTRQGIVNTSGRIVIYRNAMRTMFIYRTHDIYVS